MTKNSWVIERKGLEAVGGVGKREYAETGKEINYFARMSPV